MENLTAEEILKASQQIGAFPIPTLDDWDLGGIDCDVCNNRGIVSYVHDGYLYSRECDCMPIRRSMRKIRKSGMADMLNRYTFETFETPNTETRSVFNQARAFCNDTGWLYICGKSGSGKTHICTAVCSELISKGVEVYYMSWKDESTRLKAIINDEESYKTAMDKLKRVPVLYIDDFFKGGCTDADLRLAFEIINNRYNTISLRTIISSEYPIEFVLDKDEALGGRIYERAKRYMIKAPSQNWRLR